MQQVVTGVLTAMVLSLAVSGCVAGGNGPFSAAKAAPAVKRAPSSGPLTGVWEGALAAGPCTPALSKAGRCDATNELRLTFIQDGSKVAGYYQCAIGNTACRDLQDSGSVSEGSLSGKQLKFEVDFSNDDSSCVFHGQLSAAVASGAYACYAGGREIESGDWHVVKKSRAVPPEPLLFE